jgi:tyrosyl-tRNA synthetase
MTTEQLQSAFLSEASARGYIYQATDMAGLDSRMSSKNIAAYTGFDCTAKSLHVGMGRKRSV